MSRMFARSDFEKISFLSISWGHSYIILWNLVEVSAAHTLLAAMLIIVGLKHVTLSFCVMRMLLKVIWSPGLDMQSSQGIHCRNSMLTCTNTTITTPAIVALLFKWWTYSRKYSKAGQIFLMCNKTGKKAECSSERRDEKISYFLAGVAGTSWHVNNYRWLRGCETWHLFSTVVYRPRPGPIIEAALPNYHNLCHKLCCQASE